jgi:hypothetical protein
MAIPLRSPAHNPLPLRNNQNQPKPTNNEFLNPVGFGWFKLVLVGLGYQVPENAGKTPSFSSASRPLSQPKPTSRHGWCKIGAKTVNPRAAFDKNFTVRNSSKSVKKR